VILQGGTAIGLGSKDIDSAPHELIRHGERNMHIKQKAEHGRSG
jgi:hypothetical protein